MSMDLAPRSIECWRCDVLTNDLVHDPMMPITDSIKICPSCAAQRVVLMRKYKAVGRNIQIHRPEGDYV